MADYQGKDPGKERKSWVTKKEWNGIEQNKSNAA